MELRKVNVGNSPYANANMVAVENGQLIYLSVLGYDSSLKTILKEINRKNFAYVERMGTMNTAVKGYEVLKHKHPESDYAHALVYRKDSVTTNNNNEETLSAYIYTSLPNAFNVQVALRSDDPFPQELADRIYDKLYKYTPVPILPQWMEYITRALFTNRHIFEINMFKPADTNFRIFRLNIRFHQLFTLVSHGLQNHAISVNGSNTVSETMRELTGLDSYLNTFTETLARKIQESFVPKFIPGENEISERLQTFDDYAICRGNLRMYEAQKAVAQASSNNLERNKISFVIGEMGIGSIVCNF